MTGTKHQIFIVEDSPEDITLILETLGDEYDLRVYTSGESALSELRKQPPSLVLLDVILPGESGYEICRFLKMTDKTMAIPIVFLTSLERTSAEEKCLGLGAADFIQKPIDPAILRRRVQNQINILDLSAYQHLVYERLSYQRECQTISNVTITLLSAMDKYTGEHVENTCELYHLLANSFAADRPGTLAAEKINVMAQASSLHDIGKCGISLGILGKCGPLSAEEVVQIQQHPHLGDEIIGTLEDILGKTSFLKYAREMALFHHEKWNGTGYPQGLKGNEIPLSARIMALVDVYDALTSNRSYRKSLSHDTAVRIITEGDEKIHAGHFDPEVLEAFLLVEQEVKYLQERFLIA